MAREENEVNHKSINPNTKSQNQNKTQATKKPGSDHKNRVHEEIKKPTPTRQK